MRYPWLIEWRWTGVLGCDVVGGASPTTIDHKLTTCQQKPMMSFSYRTTNHGLREGISLLLGAKRTKSPMYARAGRSNVSAHRCVSMRV
jgi:hypothetical protein